MWSAQACLRFAQSELARGHTDSKLSDGTAVASYRTPKKEVENEKRPI